MGKLSAEDATYPKVFASSRQLPIYQESPGRFSEGKPVAMGKSMPPDLLEVLSKAEEGGTSWRSGVTRPQGLKPSIHTQLQPPLKAQAPSGQAPG